MAYHNEMSEDFTQEKLEKIVQDLSRFVNVGTDFSDVFADALSREHRTLQASIIKNLLNGLVKYAKNAEVHQFIDMRNEAAVKVIRKITPTIVDNPIPFI
jgi:hypothetical protein